MNKYLLQAAAQQGAGLNQNEPETTALLARMVAVGDTVSPEEANLLNHAIKTIKDANLFTSRFDAIWVTTSRIGRASSKLNWIKDAHNLTEVPDGGVLTFEAGVGYHSDGTKSYLKTNYDPSIHADKFKLADASFGVCVGGTIGDDVTNYTGHGNATVLMRNNLVNYRNQINGVGGFGLGKMRTKNLSTITTGKQFSRNYGEQVLTGSPTAIGSGEIYLLKANDGVSFCCKDTEVLEFAFIGAAITEAENDFLNSVFYAYKKGVIKAVGNSVAFTFDDMIASDYTVLKPLFNTKNIKASCNAIISKVGTAGFVTWAQISEMVADGFDIGDHSIDHQQYPTLTDEQLAAQFQGVNDAFIANGLLIPKHGAYPFGANATREQQYAANYGRLSMRGAPFAYTYKNTNKYQLPAMDITAVGSVDLFNTLSNIDGCLEAADKHLILYAHETRVGETSGNILGTIPMTRIINYCNNIGITIKSQAQLYEDLI